MSARAQQQLCNTKSPPPVAATTETSTYLDKLYSSVTESELKEDVKEISLALIALSDLVKYKAISVDMEWVVEKYSNDRIIGPKEVALVQIGYVDDEDKVNSLLIHTKRFVQNQRKRVLPHRLEALLTRADIYIIDFNMSADLKKIGRDFNVESIRLVMQKNRPNVINLGMYAQEQDIVTNGGAEMAEVAQVMKGLVLDQGSKEDRYSD